MKLRSPLSNARGLGSAKEGFSHWWWQRLSAVALVPLSLWFVYSVLSLLGAPYEVAHEWMQSPLNAGLMMLFVVISIFHGQTGVQVVIEDYIHTRFVNLACLLLVKAISVLLAAVSVVSILKVAVGG